MTRTTSPTPDAPRAGRRPLATKQQASRDAILQAAAEAFVDRGYAATSIDEIAERLGCTKGRIYHYFRTKGELFLGIHTRALDLALGDVGPIAKGGGTPVERLHAMVVAHARLMMTEHAFMRLSARHAETHLATEGRTPDSVFDEILRMREAFEDLFVDVIREGVRSGELRKVDPKLVVKAALGSTNWMSLWYRPRPDERRSRVDQIADEFATFVVNGLRAR